jgi:capsular exopolysaccharide synthesis family protein
MSEPHFSNSERKKDTGKFHPPVPRSPSSLPEPSSAPSRARLVRSDSNQRGTGQSVNTHVVLHAMRRWWKLALPVSLLLAAAAVGAVYVLFEPQYEAAALLEINETTPFIAFQLHEGGVSKSYFNTQLGLIRSPWILGRTVIMENVKDLPEIRKNQPNQVEWLRKRINVSPIGDSDLFEIRYASASPDSAYLVVNEVTRQYLLAQEEVDARHYRNIMEAALVVKQNQENKVNDLRKQIAETAKSSAATAKNPSAAVKNSAEDPENREIETNELGKNPVTLLQTRLIEVQVEGAILAARIKAITAEAPVPAPAKGSAEPPKNSKPVLTADQKELRDHLVEMQLNAAPEVAQLNFQLRSQQIALKKMVSRLKQKEQDPLYKQKQRDIDTIKDSIKEAKNSLREDVEKDVDFTLRTHRGEGAAGLASDGVMHPSPQDEKKDLEEKLRLCVITEESLKKAYSEALGKALKAGAQLSDENLNMRFRKDELADAQQVLAHISERVIALQTERAAPPRVVLHDAAKKPEVPTEIIPVRNMSLAGLAAFFLPFALAVAWEVRARRISSPDDLEQQLHLAVLGEVARLPSRPRTDLRGAETRIGSELRIFEESIDSLRTTLTLSENLRDMRILAITSAANHEGKTSVASQLAMSLARATGKTTLLIDGDMRSPDVHQVFGVARGPGLAEVLSGECKFSDAIVATHNPNVQLLPAGRLKVSPHRLLGNGAWKSLLAQIPTSYGYVIIDTPPVLAASEALVLSKHADAILICVMRDVSRADQVRKASNLLTAAGGCPVGTVLNGVPIRSYKYYYGTYPSPAASSQA